MDGGKYDIRNNLKYLRYQFTPRGELKDVKKAMPFAYTEITNFSNGDAENVVAEEGV